MLGFYVDCFIIGLDWGFACSGLFGWLWIRCFFISVYGVYLCFGVFVARVCDLGVYCFFDICLSLFRLLCMLFLVGLFD